MIQVILEGELSGVRGVLAKYYMRSLAEPA